MSKVGTNCLATVFLRSVGDLLLLQGERNHASLEDGCGSFKIWLENKLPIPLGFVWFLEGDVSRGCGAAIYDDQQHNAWVLGRAALSLNISHM